MMTPAQLAGNRARTLAFLLATTALSSVAAQAQETLELPAVEGAAATSQGQAAGSQPALQPPSLSPVTLFNEAPTGQVSTTIPQGRLENTKAFSVLDILRDSPGVETKQGNGPRDVSISIRGSGAKVGFGIRNIVIFEDGFPVTQPDGLSRTDLTDPHAYSGIDVIRGPSSALFGNYATGGAINFRTRTGGEINGFEAGTDAGSFNYLNNYLAYGLKKDNVEASLFVSNVIGNGPTPFNRFNTQTINFLGTYQLTPDDKFTLKVINNSLYGDLSYRLSLDQFYANPYQSNCYNYTGLTSAQINAKGCGGSATTYFINGVNGARVPLSAYQAGLHRHDSRSILGLRWEHNLGNNLLWRTQVVYDDKNINQPTGNTSAVGDEPAINFITDLTGRGQIFGFDALHYFGGYFNTESVTNYTYNVKPGGNATLGAITNISPTQQTNFGLRGREEVRLAKSLTGVFGFDGEVTHLLGNNDIYSYSASGSPTIKDVYADKVYYNIAPEGSLVFRPNNDWLVKARIGTGFGTPQASNLFVLPNGAFGNNTLLKTQTNLGYDLGVDWTPVENLKFSVDGFYEFFTNELVSLTPPITAAVPSPQSYTFNAPSSQHRGVEVAAEWRFLDGWKAKTSYTYNNQIYTNFYETLSNGSVSSTFNRAGNRLPGVSPNLLTARLGYDVLFGPLKGLGAYAEYYLTDAFFLDNGNLLKAPGSQIVNLNVHYDADLQNSFIQKIGAFFEVRNVGNTTYLASANNLSNSINARGQQNPGYSTSCPTTTTALSCATGSMYAGMPRTFVGGLRVKF